MAVLLFICFPLLIPNLVYAAVSRRRLSLSLALFNDAFASGANLLLSILCLIPQERMRVFSSGGMLQLSAGKSALLFCLALDFVLGAAAGLLIREQELPLSPDKKPHPLRSAPALLLLFLLIFLTQAYFWGQINYGNTTLDQILFYLKMPLEGTSTSFAQNVLHSVLLPSLLLFLPLLLLSVIPARSKSYGITLPHGVHLPLLPLRFPLRLAYPLLLVWLAVLLVQSNSMLKIDAFITSRLNASTFIEENYVSPDEVSIAFPEQKRNLITVYLESYETTPQDAASGGVLDVNLIPEMTAIAQEHTSFSRNDRITGAAVPLRSSWTMAGLIAQTAGLPLLNIINEGQHADTLLPAAITLGDLLKEQGYRLMFLAGSDFTFGGRRAYYRAHGDYEIWDLLSAREEGILPPDYYEGWGFEDLKLYEYAKEKISELAQSGQPFHFAMLTVDTHTPGYICPECPAVYDGGGSDSLLYANALRCSSLQFSKFLSWCQAQPFYENTTIVVTGDHQTMQEYFYLSLLDQSASENLEHYVYNAFINSAAQPVQETNRLFTTLDFFPTVLASLGATIEGDRLALGTNLFSDRETLSEQYGEDYLLAELEKKSIFYEEHLLYRSDDE